MDPLTLFALANGAVAAVKKGCQLYKDIKGAAGDVKAVLKDLDEQFHGAYEAKGKIPSTEAKKQFVEEKNRIIELNKRDGETAGIYTELGEHLGAGLYTREVEYLCREEWAMQAEDILWRRTKLGLHLPASASDQLQTWLNTHPLAR